MLGISWETERTENLIRFPHPENTSNLFYLENGKDIILYDSYDHKRKRYTCHRESSDCMHFRCGHQIYHIHQFAETMARNGHTYEPAEPISNLDLFEKRYLDRTLKGEDGALIPYRMIWINNNTFINSEDWHSRQMPVEDRLAICICPAAEPKRQVCLMDGKFSKEFLSVSDLYSRLPDIPMANHEVRQILHSARLAEKNQSLDLKLQTAVKKAAALSESINIISAPEKSRRSRQEETRQ